MHSVSKRYGPTVALDAVSLAARPGRVLGLVGENGAGKSTLMKALAGAVRPDAGAMTLAGAPYAPAGPTAARAAGVAMIYQELNLAPDLSVEDNLMLGRERARFGLLDRREQRRRCRAALAKLGHGSLDVRTPVGRLPAGLRQVVEIARAVLDEARVVAFDEPTSSLPRKEAEALFAVIRTLTAGGAAVIYISHFLEEVRTVCDDYAVLRDGRAVGSGELKDVTEPELVSLMVGRTVDDLFPRVPHTPGEVLLTLDGLAGAGAGGVPAGVSLGGPPGRDPRGQRVDRRGPNRTAAGDLRARRRPLRPGAGERGGAGPRAAGPHPGRDRVRLGGPRRRGADAGSHARGERHARAGSPRWPAAAC